MSFSNLGLSDKVLAAVAATGYTNPTPIQEQAIPTSSPGVTCSASPRQEPARLLPSPFR